MPWVPELFTAPALQQLQDKRRRDALVTVPFFDGLLAGEPDALVGSFAGQPELHDPVRGRVKGVRAFREYVAAMGAWLERSHAAVQDVELVILGERGVDEVVLHVDGEHGRVGLPFAIVADHPSGGPIEELRLYYSGRPLTGHGARRPPLLQRDPDLHPADVVAEYELALAAGDVDAVVAAFEPDGCVHDPAGGRHMGPDGLRAFYAARLADGGGGIPLETCTLVDDGRTCALEHNVTRPGAMPQAGVAVHVRGPSGRLAVVRVYDDAGPSGDPAAARRSQP
jgi:ketosteroid isomerase-like protein